MANTMKNVRILAIAIAVLCAVAFMPLLSDSLQSHAAAKLKVSKTKVTVTVGQSVKVKANKKATWKSKKTTIANITAAKGKSISIQGIKAGTTTVTAKYGKKTVKIKVTVKAAPKPAAPAVSKNTTVNPSGYVKENDISVTGYYQGDATVYSLLYQESAEVAAMQIQAFSLAKERLDDAIAANTENKPLAIVTDIDSTIADDTCYIAGAVLDAAGRIGVKYFATDLEPWVNDDWCGYYQAVATEADTVIPGAKQFVDYAYSKGVEWYYITNRPYYELDLTVQQLSKQGFFEKYDPTKSGLGYTDTIVNDFAKVKDYQEYHYPGWYDTKENNPKLDQEVQDYAAVVNAEGTGLEMANGSFSVKNDYRVQVQGSGFSSDKSDRRANVKNYVEAKGGQIIMYMGDSINDMVSDKENPAFTRGQLNEDRTGNVSKVEWAGDWGKDQSVKDGADYNPGHWGYDYIVLPNATYGDWYKTTWGNNKVDGVSGKTQEGQQQAIYDQIWRHSYLNPDYGTWYDGPSPVTNVVQ